MSWIVVFLVLGGALALGRIAYQINRMRKVKLDDWDTKLIERLRRGGSDPFASYEVDFFVALPSEQAAQSVAEQLSRERFTVDVRAVADSVSHPFSVHAMRSMQLNVDGIREISTRMREVAAASGGRYDGWAPGKISASGPTPS